MKNIDTDRALSLPLDELILTANRVREEHCGSDIEACGIINAKSGVCREDCKFCSQSVYYKTDIKRYPLVDAGKIVRAAEKAEENGAKRFGIVTSGNRLSPAEIGIISGALESIRQNLNILPCASLGSVGKKDLSILKSAGLVRYHHNLETSERFYPNIVTSHKFDERVRTVNLARSIGLEVCSGGIFGVGETMQDRVDLVLLLKELEVDAVPLNFFMPIKGTPFENKTTISPADAVKTTALFRIILENRDIKIVAGRESILKDFQALLYMAGANGMMIGGYLTKQGRSLKEDQDLIKQVQELWSKK